MSAWIYRTYDASGRLLYIGSSVNVDQRLREHSKHAAWWPFHSLVEREEFPTLVEARASESIAILAEHPRWNMIGRSPQHPDGFARTANRASWLRVELAAGRNVMRLAAERSALAERLARVEADLQVAEAVVALMAAPTQEVRASA